jgi:hypothetical protein
MPSSTREATCGAAPLLAVRLADFGLVDFVARMEDLRVTLARDRLYKTRFVGAKEKAPDVSIRGSFLGLAS